MEHVNQIVIRNREKTSTGERKIYRAESSNSRGKYFSTFYTLYINNDLIGFIVSSGNTKNKYRLLIKNQMKLFTFNDMKIFAKILKKTNRRKK